MLDPQQRLRISIRDLVQTLLVNQPTLLQFLHEPHSILVLPEWVIDREQNMVDPGISQDTRHGIHTPVPAGSDPQVLVVDGLEGASARTPADGELVDAREHEWQHFAHVSDDELQARERVEEAAGEEAEDMCRDVRVPAECGCGDGLRGGEREVARVERREHVGGGPGRVQVDRDVEVLGCLEEWEVFWSVEVLAGGGVVVDQGADEAEFLDAPREFVGARSRLADGQDREACKAIWVLLHRVGELVVGGPAFPCGHGSRCVRDDLQRDVVRVHAGQSQWADIREFVA